MSQERDRESAAAAEALRRQFDKALTRAAGEEEPPGFAEVSAYVDGTLDDVDREILESRLESDPVLRAEVEELSALRDAMRAAREAEAARAIAQGPDVRAGAAVRAAIDADAEAAAPSETLAGMIAGGASAEAAGVTVGGATTAGALVGGDVSDAAASDPTSKTAEHAVPGAAPVGGRARAAVGAAAGGRSGAAESRPASSTAPFAARAAGRVAGGGTRTRSALSLWMIASLATAAAAVVLVVTWSTGVPPGGVTSGPVATSPDATIARGGDDRGTPAPTRGPSPPTSSQAGGSAPPASGAATGSSSPGSTSAGSTSAGSTSPGPPSPGSTSPGSPAAGATAPTEVAVRDGALTIVLEPDGRVAGVPSAFGARKDMVAQALRAGTLPGVAAHQGLGRRELTLMGGGASVRLDALAVLAPVATVVREWQPTFRWTPQAGARSYVVTIYSESFDVVLASQPIRETTWTASSALLAGRIYQWQVTADTPDGPVHAPAPPAPDARFRILGDAARRALDRDLAGIWPSRLLSGLLFADVGLIDDAEQSFRELARENPGSAAVARLLSSVRERKEQP